MADAFRSILDKLDVSTSAGIKAKKKRKLGKRETVIFAALLLQFTGTKYCSFLQDHGIKPKWPDSGPATYLPGYKAGDPWRKKIQDEKTRAKRRMSDYDRSELATALCTYLPEEFDKKQFHSPLAQREEHE